MFLATDWAVYFWQEGEGVSYESEVSLVPRIYSYTSVSLFD